MSRSCSNFDRVNLQTGVGYRGGFGPSEKNRGEHDLLMPEALFLCTIGVKFFPLQMEAEIVTDETFPVVSNIQDARPTFEKAIEESDLDLLTSLFMDDAWMLPPSSPILKGREAIMTYYKGMLSVGEYEMRFQNEELNDYGDIAVEIGSWSMNVKTADTSDHQAQGKSMVVWRKTDAGWRIARDMFSSNNPED